MPEHNNNYFHKLREVYDFRFEITAAYNAALNAASLIPGAARRARSAKSARSEVGAAVGFPRSNSISREPKSVALWLS
jgi:hypothetical protein